MQGVCAHSLSYENAWVAELNCAPMEATYWSDAPLPGRSRHTTEESDSQLEPMHTEPPTASPGLKLRPPKLDPNTVTSTEPVVGPLVRVICVTVGAGAHTGQGGKV